MIAVQPSAKQHEGAPIPAVAKDPGQDLSLELLQAIIYQMDARLKDDREELAHYRSHLRILLAGKYYKCIHY